MNYENLIAQLQQHEGFRSKPYKCTAGKWTVGYGRNLDDVGMSDDEQKARFGCVYEDQALIDALNEKPLSEPFAKTLLEIDIAKAEGEAQSAVNLTGLNAAREAVVINMLFNLGLPRFLKFKNTIDAINECNFELAAAEMMNSRWYYQVGNRGVELCEQMKTGQWQL